MERRMSRLDEEGVELTGDQINRKYLPLLSQLLRFIAATGIVLRAASEHVRSDMHG